MEARGEGASSAGDHSAKAVLCSGAVGTASEDGRTAAPRVSVVFLLYRSAEAVPSLLEALVRQVDPSFTRQADWLEALFMDDGSGDGTADAVERALAAAGHPPHYRLIVNPRNLGLAGTPSKLVITSLSESAATGSCADVVIGAPTGMM